MFPVYCVDNELLAKKPKGVNECAGILVRNDEETGNTMFVGVVFENKDDLYAYIEETVSELRHSQYISTNMATYYKNSLCKLINYLIDSVHREELPKD